MAKRVGVVRFLGTNCDRDLWLANELMGLDPKWLWYEDQFDEKSVDAIMVPGGFSYGDYLRAGALAAKTPVMESVRRAASRGVPILGICNGFQVLCESRLLPGVLVQNTQMRFVDEWTTLKLENGNPHWGRSLKAGKQVTLPSAHGEGRYYAEDDEIQALFDQQQVWWSYGSNPNGSLRNIAGVMNKEKNVAGLMPHPERAMQEWMGGDEGRLFWEGLN